MLLTYSDEIQKDIDNIIIQIKNGTLKENVNWGIHPTKCIAIPYRCKDTPLLTSNFLSVMLTIFLTLYYYISIKKYQSASNLATFNFVYTTTNVNSSLGSDSEAVFNQNRISYLQP